MEYIHICGCSDHLQKLTKRSMTSNDSKMTFDTYMLGHMSNTVIIFKSFKMTHTQTLITY